MSQTRRWGTNLTLTATLTPSHSLWPHSCLPGLSQPNLRVWAVFVFSRLLSPKLLSFLIQRVSSFFTAFLSSVKEYKRTILGMVANCSAHEILHGHKISVGTLLISERIWGCRQQKSLLGKDRKLLSEDKIPQSKWGEEQENYTETFELKKGTVIKVRAGLGFPVAKTKRVRPQPHCPEPEAHLRWTETTSTPNLSNSTFSW